MTAVRLLPPWHPLAASTGTTGASAGVCSRASRLEFAIRDFLFRHVRTVRAPPQVPGGKDCKGLGPLSALWVAWLCSCPAASTCGGRCPAAVGAILPPVVMAVSGLFLPKGVEESKALASSSVSSPAVGVVGRGIEEDFSLLCFSLSIFSGRFPEVSGKFWKFFPEVSRK